MSKSITGWCMAVLALGITLVLAGPTERASATGGTMTQDGEGYYLVEDAYDLQAINTNLSGKFRLADDIDLENVDVDGAGPIPVGQWKPIGDVGTPFTGEFDGNGFTIRNLHVSGTANHVGLFGVVSGANIHDVRLTNVDVSGVEEVGGLAGYATGSHIDDSSASGTVQGGALTGLLVGYAVSTDISDSYSQGTVGDIYTVDPNYQDDHGFGGLVGTVALGSVDHSYSAAVLDAADTPDNLVGGLIGDDSGSVPFISASFWDAEASGINHSAGGAAKTTAEMMRRSTFKDAGWDFAGKWAMIDGVTYPLHADEYRTVALASLTVVDADDATAPLAWSRAFSGDVGVYTVKAVTATSNVTISATPVDSSAQVSLMVDADSDGRPDSVVDPDGVATVALDPGENRYWVHVESGSGELEAAYQLTIIRDDGTAAHPHRVTTPELLAAIGDASKGYDLDDAYELDADLDLSAYGAGFDGGAGWKPIGAGMGGFQGEFHGNGHAIAHLYIDRSGSADQGLFGSIAAGAVVQDVHLRDLNVRGGMNTGGLAGVNGGTIAGASVDGTVEGGSNVGGLAGGNVGGTILDSFALGTVSGHAQIGGLVGLNTDAGAQVSGSYAAAVVGFAAGGIGPTGGLVGESQNGAIVETSFWDRDVSLQASSAGSPGDHGKTTAEMMLRSTYEADGWSIDPADSSATWGMVEGTSYPMPRAVYETVTLSSLTVDFAGAAAAWSDAFTPESGVYEVEASLPTTSADIQATAATVSSSVYIDGTGGATRTIALHPGHNPVTVEVVEAGGLWRAAYSVDLVVPAPAGGSTGTGTGGGASNGDDTPKPPAFTDVSGHWAEEAIRSATDRGIVHGYPDGTFRPDDSVTRAEFTVILARALGLEGGDAGGFADQTAIPEWARDAVAAVASAGIVHGYEDGTFRADAFITRSEIAVMIAKALGLPIEDGAVTHFADEAAIPSWARPYVAAAVDAGLIAGRDDGRFDPLAPATRSEATVLLLRLLESLAP